MDPAHAPFLAAILADIDSDAPRLRYADFLDETGDPVHEARAEFIRVQCALEEMQSDDPRYEELGHRETKLFQSHWKEWFGPIAAALGTPIETRRLWTLGFSKRMNLQPDPHPPGRCHSLYSTSITHSIRDASFRRGFFHSVRLNLARYVSMTTGNHLASVTPFRSFSPGGEVEQVHSLIFHGPNFESPAGVVLRELAFTERYDLLRSLSLDFFDLHLRRRGNSLMRILAGATHLKGLRTLDLSSRAGALDVSLLMDSPLLGQCERFFAFHCVASDEFLHSLADPRRTPALRGLLWTSGQLIDERTVELLRERFGPDCTRIGEPQ
jgi:uncharacterized protein (TIGR02996 family)